MTVKLHKSGRIEITSDGIATQGATTQSFMGPIKIVTLYGDELLVDVEYSADECRGLDYSNAEAARKDYNALMRILDARGEAKHVEDDTKKTSGPAVGTMAILDDESKSYKGPVYISAKNNNGKDGRFFVEAPGAFDQWVDRSSLREPEGDSEFFACAAILIAYEFAKKGKKAVLNG